ncbi:MAG: hypothetical protein ACPG4X_15615 [Pikeienuella sp.]
MNNPRAAENLTAPKFKRGQSGNPGGKTAQQREDEIRAAEIAARLRLQMLEALEQEGETILERLDANTLKLFKDSEDRAHGTPKSTTEMSGPEGGAIPVAAVEYTIYDPKKMEDD